MKFGTRVRYWWGKKPCIGRFLYSNGAYHYFMRGPGKLSSKAQNVVELYPNEFKVIK